MSNLRSDCRDLVRHLPPGDSFRSHIERLCYQIDTIEEYWHEAVRQRNQLLTVIRDVHAQHADDLCWMPADVNKIFVAAGLPPQDLHVGDVAAMRKNCDRYTACLKDGGPWKSYAELEAENAQLRMSLEGRDKAIKLLTAGMESQAEICDELKQKVRALEALRGAV